MSFSLTMNFLTEIGEKTSMSISNVRDNLTESEVLGLMDIILSNDVFNSKKGALSSKVSAQLVEKNITKFEI
jgi:hypothetical protein